MRMIVQQLVEWRLAGENEVLGEKLPQRHFVHHKSHMTRPGLEPRAAAVGSHNYFLRSGLVTVTILECLHKIGRKGNEYALFNKVEMNLRTVKLIFCNYVFDGI
jgi:hypothetical protein